MAGHLHRRAEGRVGSLSSVQLMAGGMGDGRNTKDYENKTTGVLTRLMLFACTLD